MYKNEIYNGDLTRFMGMEKMQNIGVCSWEPLIQSIGRHLLQKGWLAVREAAAGRFLHSSKQAAAEKGGAERWCWGLHTVFPPVSFCSLSCPSLLFVPLQPQRFLQFIWWLEPWAQAENWTLNTVLPTYLVGTSIPSPWKMDISWINDWICKTFG